MPLVLYGAQLAANLAWSPLFFKAKDLTLASADIAALVGLAAATAVSFEKHSPAASKLLYPYLGWCSVRKDFFFLFLETLFIFFSHLPSSSFSNPKRFFQKNFLSITVRHDPDAEVLGGQPSGEDGAGEGEAAKESEARSGRSPQGRLPSSEPREGEQLRYCSWPLCRDCSCSSGRGCGGGRGRDRRRCGSRACEGCVCRQGCLKKSFPFRFVSSQMRLCALSFFLLCFCFDRLLYE